MQNFNNALRSVIKQNDLTLKETAILSGLSINTIAAYLAKPTSKKFRAVPKSTLTFIKKAIADKKNLTDEIHQQFKNLLDELKKVTVLDRAGIEQVADKIDDIWVNYVTLDADASCYKAGYHPNEEFEEIARLQNKTVLNAKEKEKLLALTKKHGIKVSIKSEAVI